MVNRSQPISQVDIENQLMYLIESLESETEAFEQLASRAALAVNGVLVRHRKRLKTQLDDGDRVTFVKAAAGG